MKLNTLVTIQMKAVRRDATYDDVHFLNISEKSLTSRPLVLNMGSLERSNG